MIIRKSGFTWNPHSRQEMKQGYAVSPYEERGAVISIDNFKKHGMAMTRAFEKKNADLLKDPKNCIGGWLNKENGKVYLDISIVTKDKQEAIRLSDKHSQLAFYSLHEGKQYDMNQMDPKELADAQAAKEKKGKSKLSFHILPGGKLSDADIQEFVDSITAEAEKTDESKPAK